MSKSSDFLPKLRWQVTSCITSIALCFAIFMQYGIADPIWWSTPEIDGGDTPIQSDATVNNYAVGNLGQVKNMVQHAAEYFTSVDIDVPPESQQMLDTWADSDVNNFAAVNIGQVKAAAEPFWNKLIELGQADTSDIPWSVDRSDDDNYAIANIGQIKSAFNFAPLDYDIDKDDLVDAWEILYFGNLAQIGSDDFDGDGVSNLNEYNKGTNPTLVPSHPFVPVPEKELANYGLRDLNFENRVNKSALNRH